MKINIRLLSASITSILLVSQLCFAETLTKRGIGTHADRDSREPELSVETIWDGDILRILAAAHVPNNIGDFPLQFDFYVNGQSIARQLRSEAVPMSTYPVGVNIGENIHNNAPVLYQVVAKSLWPNRTFTTIIEGLAFQNDNVGSFDCTLTEDSSSSTESFVASSVTSSQSSESTLGFVFEAEPVRGGNDDRDVTANLTIGTDLTVSGTVLVDDDISPQIFAVTGTATRSSSTSEIESVTVSSETSVITLSCS